MDTQNYSYRHTVLFCVHMKWSGNISRLVSNSWVSAGTSQFNVDLFRHTYIHTLLENDSLVKRKSPVKRFNYIHTHMHTSKTQSKAILIGHICWLPQQMQWLALFFRVLFLPSLCLSLTHTHTQSCSFVTSCVFFSVSANEKLSFRPATYSTQVC